MYEISTEQEMDVINFDTIEQFDGITNINMVSKGNERGICTLLFVFTQFLLNFN